MTNFAQPAKGGESEERAIVAGDPQASYLLDQLKATDGEAFAERTEEQEKTLSGYYQGQDTELTRLRADLRRSTEQVKNKRLIGVQDLAWALINTPAFLFNR